MRWLLICLALAGCARAGKENSIIGGLTDARPRIDASPVGAGSMTLTETASETITVGAKFGCASASSFTRENSYYRVFTLSDYSITTTLHVTQVDFGIDTATAGSGGTQPATINVGTYGGPLGAATLDVAQVSPINSANIQIPDGSGTKMTVPIAADIASTTSVIVELAIADGVAAQNTFYIGVNAEGERQPGYTRRPSCGASSPATMASLGFGETDIVLTVTGNADTVPD